VSLRDDRLCENMDISRWQKAGGDRSLVGTCVSHVRGRAIGTSLHRIRSFRTV
jgi:hypothetical protein